jgi:hypothetical protein
MKQVDTIEVTAAWNFVILKKYSSLVGENYFLLLL